MVLIQTRLGRNAGEGNNSLQLLGNRQQEWLDGRPCITGRYAVVDSRGDFGFLAPGSGSEALERTSGPGNTGAPLIYTGSTQGRVRGRGRGWG